jgi:hypothetical protein
VNLRKIYEITKTLVKSQLRSGRGSSLGARLTNNPMVVFAVDVIVFIAAAGLVSLILGVVVGELTPDMVTLLNSLTVQAVSTMPALIAPAIFIGAVLFELSVSSKFASSDVVNWLPVSQTDYVTASTLSVSYMYSFVPALALGATYPLAARLGLQAAWGVSGLLTMISLFAIGALIEIMRAAINRVSSLVYGKAGRGTIVIRLAVTVVVILAVQLAFNPLVLSRVVGTLSGAVNATFFVPFFWPSTSVNYLVQGEVLLSVVFFALFLAFASLILFAAVRIRTKFWSPVPVTIEVSEGAYSPHTGGILQSLGLSVSEAALVRKDLRGYTRRRELMPYLALPLVFVALLLVQQVSLSAYGSPETGGSYYPYWLIGGIMAVMVGATSVGEEGKAILNVYASPLSPRSFFRAKLVIASLFGSMTVLALLLVTSILESASLAGFLASLAVSLVIAMECTFVGVGMATRYPDLQDRPRPRFIRPMGMILSLVVGMVVAFLTALPLVIWPFVGGFLEGLGLSFGLTVGGGLVFGLVISFVSYRWALSGSTGLLAEIPV